MYMKWISAVILTFSIAACSSKDDSSSTTQTTNDIQRAYQVKINGCDSGYHAFTGNDLQTVLSNYCAALQNRRLNNDCPDYGREQIFNEECAANGYTWKPIAGN